MTKSTSRILICSFLFFSIMFEYSGLALNFSPPLNYSSPKSNENLGCNDLIQNLNFSIVDTIERTKTKCALEMNCTVDITDDLWTFFFNFSVESNTKKNITRQHIIGFASEFDQLKLTAILLGDVEFNIGYFLLDSLPTNSEHYIRSQNLTITTSHCPIGIKYNFDFHAIGFSCDQSTYFYYCDSSYSSGKPQYFDGTCLRVQNLSATHFITHHYFNSFSLSLDHTMKVANFLGDDNHSPNSSCDYDCDITFLNFSSETPSFSLYLTIYHLLCYESKYGISKSGPGIKNSLLNYSSFAPSPLQNLHCDESSNFTFKWMTNSNESEDPQIFKYFEYKYEIMVLVSNTTSIIYELIVSPMEKSSGIHLPGFPVSQFMSISLVSVIFLLIQQQNWTRKKN